MIQINLTIIVSLNILSRPINSHEIHIQQSPTALDMKLSARYLILFRVFRVNVSITSRCYKKQRIVQPYFTVY